MIFAGLDSLRLRLAAPTMITTARTARAAVNMYLIGHVWIFMWNLHLLIMKVAGAGLEEE
jgi:hypothetical protein